MLSRYLSNLLQFRGFGSSSDCLNSTHLNVSMNSETSSISKIFTNSGFYFNALKGFETTSTEYGSIKNIYYKDYLIENVTPFKVFHDKHTNLVALWKRMVRQNKNVWFGKTIFKMRNLH